jgi:uncharacterized OB-fold protein
MKPSEQVKIGATRWPVCTRCGRILFPATQDTGLCSSCLQDDDPEAIQEENRDSD